MALNIGDNFQYQGKKANFERDSFATKAAMKAFPETSIDEGHIAYCAEDKQHYVYSTSNPVDDTTGKWMPQLGNIKGDVEQLKSNIVKIPIKNLCDETQFVDGYISDGKGTFNPLSQWKTSHFIDVKGKKKLVLSMHPSAAAESTREQNNFYFFLAFDEDKQPISDTYTNNAGMVLAVDSKWAYIRFAYQQSSYNLPQVEEGDSVTAYEKYRYVNRLANSDYATQGELSTKMPNYKLGNTLSVKDGTLNVQTGVNGKFIELSWVNGYRNIISDKIDKITSSTAFCCILDKAVAGDKYIISMFSSSFYNWIAVDSAFKVIAKGTTNETHKDLTIVAPERTAYMVFNARNNVPYKAEKYIDANNLVEKYDLSDLVWNAIGDSVTEIDQVQSSLTNYLQGYVTGVKNSIKFKKVNNYGKSGHLLPKNVSGYHSVFEYSDSWEKGDIYTIMLGINGYTHVYEAMGDFQTDYIGRTGWNTLFGAWREAIEYIYQKNPNAIVLLCTEHLFSDAAANQTNYNKYKAVNDATIQVAKYEQLPVIDCFYESGINRHNISLCLYDGTHPSQEGYNRITALFTAAVRDKILPAQYRY